MGVNAWKKESALALAALTVGLLIAAAALGGSVVATPIGSDPYTNQSSQHQTQVEPDSFGFGSTIVSAFQTGRFFDGGASNIAWATTTNAGANWVGGVLPGTTVYQGGPWSHVSDPAVAYDPLHNVWMISVLAFGMGASPNGAPSAILTSRSLDGGLTWQNPVIVWYGAGSFYDKNWITCDTWPSSSHYGNCYTEWDDNGLGNRILMSTSTDGGLTWSPPVTPTGAPSGLGGQPVAQPNGNVVVPYSENDAAIGAFRSTDGGVTWVNVTTVAPITDHAVAGNLRTSPLPSAEVDGQGRVYVVWQDCRFRTGCTANDIVMSTSLDGVSWTPVVRIPIDPVTSGVDHFIPGLAVDRTTSGSSARLALGYYYYPDTNCTSSTCLLTVGFVASTDGGATWTQPRRIAGPMSLSWLASTNQGPMVGDYMSTSFAAGAKAFPVFAIAKPMSGSLFGERAASARFDVTVPPRNHAVAVPRDTVRFFPHRRPEDRPETPTAH